MAANRVLPGFGLSLSYAMTYLCLLVLIPLTACFAKASSLTSQQFLAAVWSARTRSAYMKVTFGTSAIAAVADTILGLLLLAWVLVRYEFPFKRLFDSLIDLPFALPTAVAGLVYSTIYSQNGWLGQYLGSPGVSNWRTFASGDRICFDVYRAAICGANGPTSPGKHGCRTSKRLRPVSEPAAGKRSLDESCFRRLYPALTTGFALTFARGRSANTVPSCSYRVTRRSKTRLLPSSSFRNLRNSTIAMPKRLLSPWFC